jgi:hypothetical protein
VNLAEAPAGALECWCCGQRFSAERLVHLGNHPEVGVCLGCAHFLHQQAHARADQLRPSLAGRMRDQLRRARKQVRDHHWHQQPVIGPALRWLGRYLP